MIHAAILDLLQDVPDRAIDAADINELCDLLRLSSSAAVQNTAYSILSRVIKARTMGLVLEVEATVEDGQGGKEISLPTGLIEIVGGQVDCFDAAVSTVLAQLLGWMAVLDHFEDAVSFSKNQLTPVTNSPLGILGSGQFDQATGEWSRPHVVCHAGRDGSWGLEFPGQPIWYRRILHES